MAMNPNPSPDIAFILSKLTQSVIKCRPKATLKYTTRYLQEEKNYSITLSNSYTLEEYHLIQSLPYLITLSDQFILAASELFCLQLKSTPSTIPSTIPPPTQNTAPIINNLASTSGDNGNSSQAPSQSSNPTTAPTLIPAKPLLREYLDPSSVLEIFQQMDLPALGLQNTTIDELSFERIEAIKRFDFPIFLASIRFPLVSYQIYIWYKDLLLEFLYYLHQKNKIQESNPQHFPPLSDDLLLELIPLKAFLSSYKPKVEGLQSRDMLAISRSHRYHLHPISYTIEDIKRWIQLLKQIIDENQSTNNMNIETLFDRMLRKLLTNLKK